MTTNRLAASDVAPRIIPPKDAEERIRFWIERGNEILVQHGRRDLQWRCVNGHYFIDAR